MRGGDSNRFFFRTDNQADSKIESSPVSPILQGQSKPERRVSLVRRISGGIALLLSHYVEFLIYWIIWIYMNIHIYRRGRRVSIRYYTQYFCHFLRSFRWFRSIISGFWCPGQAFLFSWKPRWRGNYCASVVIFVLSVIVGSKLLLFNPLYILLF